MKAMSVIDIRKCRGCGFYYENKDNKMSCYIDDYIKDCKGTCPLPQKLKSASEYGSDEEYIKHLINWKKEIDEILGETE